MLRFLQWLLRREGLLRVANPVFGRFNPFLPEHRRDPYATWRRLREAEPVYYHKAFGAWMCTRYEDVQHVLRDKNFSTDRSEVPLVKWITRLTGSTAVMFEPGVILQFGGASDKALIIDANGATPSLTQTGSLEYRREWGESVLLPDGRVLALGGSEVKNELDVATERRVNETAASDGSEGEGQ